MFFEKYHRRHRFKGDPFTFYAKDISEAIGRVSQECETLGFALDEVAMVKQNKACGSSFEWSVYVEYKTENPYGILASDRTP